MNSSAITPPPLADSNDKLWVVLAHLSIFFGVGIVLPLIIYLVKRDESAAVAFHAKEALNFHISIYLYGLLCIPLLFVFVGFPLLIILGITSSILAIVAAVRAADHQAYRYPFTIRVIG